MKLLCSGPLYSGKRLTVEENFFVFGKTSLFQCTHKLENVSDLEVNRKCHKIISLQWNSCSRLFLFYSSCTVYCMRYEVYLQLLEKEIAKHKSIYSVQSTLDKYYSWLHKLILSNTT